MARCMCLIKKQLIFENDYLRVWKMVGEFYLSTRFSTILIKKKKTYSPAKNGNAWFMAEVCKKIEFWLREFFQSGD